MSDVILIRNNGNQGEIWFFSDEPTAAGLANFPRNTTLTAPAGITLLPAGNPRDERLQVHLTVGPVKITAISDVYLTSIFSDVLVFDTAPAVPRFALVALWLVLAGAGVLVVRRRSRGALSI